MIELFFTVLVTGWLIGGIVIGCIRFSMWIRELRGRKDEFWWRSLK